MLRIIALSCLIAFAQAETRAQHNFNQVQQTTSDQSNDFAQERQIVDSYGAPTAPLADAGTTSTFDNAWTFDAPQQVSYQPVPASPASYQVHEGFNHGNLRNPVVCPPTGLASFGGNFLTTAIQVVMGLFTFSLLISLITKFAGASFLSDIFDSERSFNPDTVSMYTELALNGIEKAKALYEDVLNKE